MKKIVMFSTFVFGSLFAQNSMANTAEDVLKRSCLKDNPLVVGESDPTLLNIYAQACDKKNKDNVNGYLVKAAERFQQLGSNWKALQLVHSLQAKNIQSNTLTDVKFMASASMANSTIEQMRTREARYLNEDATYPVAKTLVDSINSAKPASVMAVPPKVEPKKPPKPPKNPPKQPKNPPKTPKAPAKPPVKSPPNPGPFVGFK